MADDSQPQTTFAFFHDGSPQVVPVTAAVELPEEEQAAHHLRQFLERRKPSPWYQAEEKLRPMKIAERLEPN